MKNFTTVVTNKTEAILKIACLVAIAGAAPLIFKEQLVTGTIVNATLFLGVCLLGVKEALIIGLLPSTLALAAGILSPALAPVIPFIILANALLVLTFSALKGVNYWLAAIVAGLLKFGFLYFTSAALISKFLNSTTAAAVARTLTWPQLITAAAGGILAFAILKGLKNVSHSNQ